MMKPDLIRVNQIDDLDLKSIEKLYLDHINPGQVFYFKLLGFTQVLIKRAQGAYYYDQNDRKILDFAGAMGSTGVGHNHPKILKACKKFQDDSRHQLGHWFFSQYAAALAHNIAAICPNDLKYVLLGNSGSEVVEGALNMVEKYQGPSRNRILYTSNSYHGQTRGALSISDTPVFRSTFTLLHNNVRVPFGDAKAIEKALRTQADIGGIFLVAMLGGAGVIIPPDGYLQQVRKLCDQFGVLLILDEIQCGFGRAGKMFAFEYENIIPDAVVIAKPLCGSQNAMAALVMRESVYKTAFTHKKEWVINSPTTFGGMGQACVTAIETINILFDENLIENTRDTGAYFLDSLAIMQKKYPKLIKEVRGRGFIIGIEFQDFSKTLITPLDKVVSVLDERLKGGLAGFIGAILLHNHGIIVNFTGTNPNVIG